MNLIRCDGPDCGTTVPHEPYDVRGWFTLTQLEPNHMGAETKVFCTGTCVVEYLKAEKGVVVT